MDTPELIRDLAVKLGYTQPLTDHEVKQLMRKLADHLIAAELDREEPDNDGKTQRS